MTKQIRRADEFAVNSRISVDGVPSMKNLILDAITNSAVHVTKDGAHTTISCASPCFQSDDEIIAAVTEETPIVLNKSETHPEAEFGPKKAGRRQGPEGKAIADKLAVYVFPTEPFTVRQVVEATGIDQLHLINFIKSNCKEVGEEEKVAGKRGRAAKLYLKK